MKRDLALSVVFSSIVGIPIAIGFWRIHCESRDVAKRSAVRALVAEIECEATSYFDDHGTYPPRLDELAIKVFPDGGDATLIEEMCYRSAGETIVLRWGESRWIIRQEKSRESSIESHTFD
jgi:hypothetical protein